MQTSTTQRKPKARILTADSTLPYPAEVGSTECRNLNQFWLIEWLRKQRQHEIVKKSLIKRATSRRLPVPEEDAFWQAIHRTRDDADNSLKNLRATGGLLYAWAGTTALDQGGAV